MDLPRFSLAGKVALITGGSRGIGEATALLFAQAGADVAVTSRKLPDLERVADLVRAEGRRAIAIEAHAGRMDGLQGIVDRTIEELGGLDVLVIGGLTMAPSEYFRHPNLFFACEADEKMLPYTLSVVGEDSIVMATDYPHWDAPFPGAVTGITDRDDISDEQKQKILVDNARRYLGIEN